MKPVLIALLATLAVPALLSTAALAQPAMFQKSGLTASAPAWEAPAAPDEAPKVPAPPELQKKADAGDAAAMRDIGIFYHDKQGSDWGLAHKWFVKAAKKGDVEAQYCAGRDLLRSHGVPRDVKLALSWLEKAAAGGHTQAQALLGETLQEGETGKADIIVVAPNPKRAFKFLKQAAEKGNADAEYNLGFFYMSNGAADSQKSGLAYLEKAAAHGHVLAQRKLGQLYYIGAVGGKVDFDKSREYLEQAAAQDDVIAQYFLGRYYELGKGVEIDGAKAAEYFRKVDMQEDPVDEQGQTQVDLLMGAQLRLGILYRDGTGVTKDLAEAARWFARAARTGSPAAQVYLAEAYENGAGVPKDKNKAYLWYGTGMSIFGAPFPPDNTDKTGAAEAKEGIARLEKTMTPEEIAAAKQALADEERAVLQISNAAFEMSRASGGYWMTMPP